MSTYLVSVQKDDIGPQRISGQFFHDVPATFGGSLCQRFDALTVLVTKHVKYMCACTLQARLACGDTWTHQQSEASHAWGQE